MIKPLILLTNDDGYQAAGLQALVRTVSSFAEVYVVAPDGPRSGAAASITSNVPVRLTPQPPLFQRGGAVLENENQETNDASALSPLFQRGESENQETNDAPAFSSSLKERGLGGESFSCSGSPVDCVKLACEQVVPRKPDLLLSGINHGDNASISVHYSGTMGAVFEGCMKGIPSIGISQYLQRGQRYEDHPVCADALAAIARLCQQVIRQGLPQDVCLNINFPLAHSFRGWQVCRQARGQWTSEWVTATHPFGQHAFWLTGTFNDLEPDATDTDFAALRAGYASIVPVRIDMTAHEAMDDVKCLIEND